MKRPRRAKKIAYRRKPKARKKIAEILVSDPLHIDQNVVPEGKAYQWFDLTRGLPRGLVQNGWTPVPFDRHPGYFPESARAKSGGIIIENSALYENSEVWVKAELAKRIEDAKAMHRAFMDKHGGKTRTEGVPLLPADFVVTKVLKNAPPEIGPDIDVSISLLVRIPAKWAAAAAYLNLTLAEYTRRRIVMQAMVLATFGEEGQENIYQPVNLSFSPNRDI